ncbi:hypothetical protein [Rhizobacter sp. Root404]|uniref:hypothetical protein n=1 Tax=Rhizobacter sp. Root404 TaxID=1736528 RepID=UPI0006FACE19|nr:hypothetical protein [Rhizobacter sp. Root404]KQW36517.1 hypothetical protein ASC76_17790 [Rhizobacter sp. Root404]
MTWQPIASHGDTEQQVLDALDEHSRAEITQMRIAMRAEGWPTDAIERAAEIVAMHHRENNRKMAPPILRNMAVSAGAAAIH